MPAQAASTNAEAGSPKVEVEDQGPKLRCALTTCQAGGLTLPVGRLQVDVEWPAYEGDVCLFIPVIDKSGSMGGQPFEQVKTALLHMLDQTLSNRNVFTCIIPYDSRAEIMKVPRDGGAETDRWGQMQARIRHMQAGGGTSFGNAFLKIKEVLFGDTSGGKVTAQAFEAGTAEFEAQRALGRKGLLVQGAPAFVKSVVIVFMTDGQDNSRSDRSSMVEQLRSILAQWTKHVAVHTVGFSKNHDFEFLDALRKVGRIEGTFRFADPADGPDALCSKLAELTDTIVASTCLRMCIDPSPLTFWSRDIGASVVDQQILMRDGFGMLKKFVVIGQAELEDCQVQMLVPGKKVQGKEVECEVAIAFEGNAEWLDEWQAQLAEEVVAEITALAKGSHSQSLSAKLHLAFLLQRSSFLELCLQEGSRLRQLQLCTAQANAMLRGSEANIARLMDAQTATTPAPAATAITVPAPVRPSAGASVAHPNYCEEGRGRIFKGRGGKSELHMAVLCLNQELLEKSLSSSDPDATDDEGDSALAVAAAVGRLNAVKLLLANARVVECCLKRCNSDGQTPLELAALRGHWNTVKALIAAGAGEDVSKCDMEDLLQEVLSRGFHKTAATLVSEGLCSVTLETLRDRVSAETLTWIMEKQVQVELMMGAEASPEKQQMYLKRGVENGMEDLVKRLLGQGAFPDSPLECEALLQAASNLSEKSVGTRILEMLLKSSERVKTWSMGQMLMIAVAHGRLPHVELVLDHSATHIDWQDGSGRTALLAACEQRHREMIIALLNRGASRALADSSGCTPLVASCRRNHCAAVAAFLGADAPVLCVSGQLSALQVCCELGRPENLDMILKHVRREEPRARLLQEFADLGLLQLTIEGNQLECLKVLLAHGALEAPHHQALPPLHAASRAGSAAAARLLVEAGADVNERDSQGRTSLHIAVQHGRALVVRLLRTFGADTDAVDYAGCVAVSYCDSAGDEAESIQAELVDPACEHLMAVACGGDVDCREMLRFAGLPGMLPARRCLDVHAGDKWTPLMQAVVCGNDEFASCLMEADADVHREDRHGLSALFWAKALRGQELAARLVPQQRSEQGIEVQCKDGKFRVGQEASAWMEGNFPSVAALAVPCAVLETTLKAQGFEIMTEAPAETEGPFNEQESDALAALLAARRSDVRESLVFQCAASADPDSFRDGLKLGSAWQARRARLQLEVAVVAAEISSPHLGELLSTGDLKVSVVDFLRREKLLDKSSLERCALFSIASVASKSSRGVLSLQQSLLLFALLQEPEFLRTVNGAFGEAQEAKPCRPLARALLQALQALPPEPSIVYKLLPDCEETFEEGRLLAWSGVLMASSVSDVLAAKAESSTSGVVCRIKSSSSRSWSKLQGVASQERAILPDAVFKVVSAQGEEFLDAGLEELTGWCVVTLEEVAQGARSLI